MRRALILFPLFAMAVSAQVRDCQTFDLALGTTVEGALDANDCALRELTPFTSASYAKRYQLTVADPAVVTLDLTSGAFDALLVLFAANPARLIGFNNDISESSKDSRIVVNLPAGTYTVIVSSPAAGMTGEFRLSAAAEKPRACLTLTLPASGVTEGAFNAATSCRFVDLTPFSTDDGYAQPYSLTMPRNGVLNVLADTSAVDFGMVVASGATFTAFGEKELAASLRAGEVLFFVAATGEGSYKLTVSVENQRPCPLETLALGAEVSGTLATGGCRFLDYLIPSSDIRPLKLYRMTADRATVVTLDQASAEFDTYLFLFDQQARQLARNDDFDRGTDSRITIHLPAGSYTVGASAFFDDELGAYTLKSAGEAPRTCPAQDLVSGETKEGILPAEGCRFLDFVPFSQSQVFVAPFRLNAQGRKSVSLNLRSNAPGETLSLLGPQAAEVLRVAVNATDRTFEGDATLLNGSHTALLWSASATPPTYSITATINDPRNCPVNDLGPNDTQQGTLAGAPCRMTDLIPYFPVSAPAQSFRVNLPGSGRLAVTMDPSGFIPHVVILRGTDTVIGQSLSNAQAAVTMSGTLPAGEYRYQLGTRSAASAFTVRSVFQPDSATSATPAEAGLLEARVEMAPAGRSTEDALRRAVRTHSASTPLFQ